MSTVLQRLRVRRSHRADTRSEGLRDMDFIMAEIRRARRFDVPFSLALFLEPWLPAGFALQDLARRMDSELREFDYVAVNESGSFIALWMFGTPRDGAAVKALRLRGAPALETILSDCPLGLATFPADGMTYDALMERARADARAVGPRPIELQSVRQEKARWSREHTIQPSESTSTS
jgi:hypothetical protein